MWHRDFPEQAKEMWEVLAKALMMQYANSVAFVSQDDLRQAAATQTEIEMKDDGSIHFRVERN